MREELLSGEHRSLCAGSVASTPDGSSRVSRGLKPRKAANTLDTGGSDATWAATSGGTPWACSPCVERSGQVAWSPLISSEKNTPIEIAFPLFWNVARIPDAWPRGWAARCS